MLSLIDQLSARVGRVFAALGHDAAHGLVRVSDRPDLAPFQCNGAMPAAKKAGGNPRALADQVVGALADDPCVTGCSVAGPGFINLDVAPDFLLGHLREMADARTLVPQTGEERCVVLDYGGTNIAKAMHVGHLRAGIVGDALRRLYMAMGYRPIGDVHMGDWGLPMGMILAELARRYPDWPYFHPSAAASYPSESPVTIDDLEEIYPTAAAACKDDPALMEQARDFTRRLQGGEAGLMALWRHFKAVSVADIQRNFAQLNVHFDLWKGEADVHDLIAPMVERLRARGQAVESDGALVVPVARADDKKDIPPLILYKSDGAVLYGTTDLATIVERVRDYAPHRIVYCTDQRQNLHFEQVFRAAKAGEIIDAAHTTLVHAGFGTMNGTDGKPFKTRAGGVMKLQDLIAMALERARARLRDAALAADMDADEQERVARAVAVAAIRFADLKNPRHVDYVFDLDSLTSFEGKTGPYLLYQTVRIRSLLAKAGGVPPLETWVFTQGVERDMALVLCEIDQAYRAALADHSLHPLCDYGHRVAQTFSRFYAACPVLNETDASLRAARLVLTALAGRVLATVLDTLGITIPDRM